MYEEKNMHLFYNLLFFISNIFITLTFIYLNEKLHWDIDMIGIDSNVLMEINSSIYQSQQDHSYLLKSISSYNF